MTKILSEPEGFHDLWGQCKVGVYDKKAWNEFQQRLISQAKCIEDLEGALRDVLEFLPGTAMPSFQKNWVKEIIEKALGK